MKGLKQFPPEYFLKFKEKPVKLKLFSKKQEDIANLYLRRVRRLLKDYDGKIMIRGSTAFRILGKGDVEIGVYPKESDWGKVLTALRKEWGNPENLEKNYARFNDKEGEIEVEIIVLKGRDAEVDIKLHKYLLSHPTLLSEYEKIKKKYSFSKREYQRRKNEFLGKVVKRIPDY